MDCESDEKILIIENQISELHRVAGFLEQAGDEWHWLPSSTMSINLVLEEALTNTILYGFEKDEKHSLSISLRKREDEVTITIVDDGKAFDPTFLAGPDITLSAEERNIGGLGVFLIKKLMDSVQYKRAANKNFLVLTKNIKK